MLKKKIKLTIELIPHTSFYSNVRSQVTKEKWNKIRFICYRLADNKCEICGETGKQQGYEHNVECHEVWDYNVKSNAQVLTGLIALCPNCHKCKHIGLAETNGELHIVYKQLMKVNAMTEDEVQSYIKEEYEKWKELNKVAWYLDISYIDKYLSNNDPFEAFMSKY
jgi:5-methylcytosine-specific restriction endonuclease McrA